MRCSLLIFAALEGINSCLGGCKAVWAVLLLGKGFCHSEIAVAVSGASPPVAPREPARMASAAAVCWSSPGSDFHVCGVISNLTSASS